MKKNEKVEIDFLKLRKEVNDLLREAELELSDYREVLTFLKDGKSGGARGVIWDKSEGMTIEGTLEIIDIFEKYRDSLVLYSTEISKCCKIEEISTGYKNLNDFLKLSKEYIDLQNEILSKYLEMSKYLDESKLIQSKIKDKLKRND